MVLGSVVNSGSPEEESVWEESVWESDWETDDDEEAHVEKEKKKRRRRIKRRKAAAGTTMIWDNCHSCRRETADRAQYVKCARCPLRFCGICLLKKHGEKVEEEMAENVRWVCPICRGGCGPGCRMNCCTCGPCRKLYQQLEPAGRILPAAIRAGFSNVHDYLIHFETGEPPEVIARRKEGQGWTKATGGIDRSLDSHPTWAIKRTRSARGRPAWTRSGASSNHGRVNGEEPIGDLMIPEDTETLKRIREPSNHGRAKREEPILDLMIPKDTETLKRIRRPSICLTSY